MIENFVQLSDLAKEGQQTDISIFNFNYRFITRPVIYPWTL